MKNFKTKFLGLALAGLILGACSQTGTYETADIMNEQAVANKAGFKLTPFGTGNENARAFGGDCTTDCLQRGVAHTFTESYTTGTISAGANTKVVTATVTLTILASGQATYTVNYASTRTGGSSNADVVLSGTINGLPFSNPASKWGNTTPNPATVSGTYTTPAFTYDPACGATVVFTLTEVSFGTNGSFNDTNSLLPYCPDGCDDEFSATTACTGGMRSATFTFTAGDDATYKIQGGLTAHISGVVVDGAQVINVTGQGNNTISWTGALDECDVKTITVTWNSTNSDPLIIGDWTVEKDGVEVLVLDPLTCNASGTGGVPVL